MMGLRSSHHRHNRDSVSPRPGGGCSAATGARQFLTTAALALGIAAFVLPAPLADAAPRCTASASDAIVDALLEQSHGLRAEVLRLALDATNCASQKGLVKRKEILTVIDYSIPSTEPRLFVFDLASNRLLFREHVAHGVNSGGNRTTQVSNINGSRQTSLGLFVTAETYYGKHGYSLRLQGLERGFNHLARERAIVIHGAPYVDAEAARKQGRLGRSWGCPAVRNEISRKMIDTIKDGSPIFAYFPDTTWLTQSQFLSQ
jgi:hypothetical protein